MAYQAFIAKMKLQPENIHRIETEKLTPEESALLYEKEIRKFFGAEKDGFPRFDLVLLGIGKDGHTASLFPGSDSLSETKNLVVSIRAPEGISPQNRITLTFPVINHADRVVFLVSGEEKRDIFEKIIHDTTAVKKFPAAMVSPRKELIWFVCF